MVGAANAEATMAHKMAEGKIRFIFADFSDPENGEQTLSLSFSGGVLRNVT